MSVEKVNKIREMQLELLQHLESITLLYVEATESIEGNAYVHELDRLNLKLRETTALCDIVIGKINWVEAIKNNNK
ncbi:MAG: hypothetical protein H6553_06770 [Chitinophagales bacterium]|nr:hypothetical protein [Chitinophagales bacterium]